MTDNYQKWGRIGVIMGGASSERSISLKSGEAILKSLQAQGLDVVAIDLVSHEEAEVRTKLEQEGCTIAFIALHGEYGEDGSIQKILTKLNIPYSGSDEEASRRSFNKILTQNILKKAGIAVPSYVTVSKDSVFSFAALTQTLKTDQCVVKPAAEGSSIGVHLVKDQVGLDAALKDAFTYGSEVLIDTYIRGRECTVGILNDQTLPVIEIKPKVAFFDFKAKYEKGETEYIVPAVLSEACTVHMQEQALKVYQLLGCRHFARVDFILGKDDIAYCLEINTIPGFTQTSLLPKAAASVGLSFDQLTSKIVECTYGQKEKNKTYI